MPRGKRIGAFVLISWLFCWSVFEVCRKGAFMCTVNGILIKTGKIKMHFPETIHLIQELQWAAPLLCNVFLSTH